MKLFREVLQCIDGYRAGKFDPLIQEVNASFADGRQRIPTGPIFESLDFVAGIVAAVMILGPLAMAAFWAPYH